MWKIASTDHDGGRLEKAPATRRLATWSVDSNDPIELHERTGSGGIRVVLGDHELAELVPVGDDTWGSADELYARSDSLHCVFGQGQGTYALKVVWRMVSESSHRVILEPTISIQTSLLDSCPVVDLCLTGNPDAREPNDDSSSELANRVHATTWNANSSSTALLTVGDASTTKEIRSGMDSDGLKTPVGVRLRLFGEFLEKGVIRKARPWLVFDRDGRTLSPSDQQKLAKQLDETPLPLTA
ncbi:MAG: hypothetical protein AAF670_16730 [Planctomycetota bacterium]